VDFDSVERYLSELPDCNRCLRFFSGASVDERAMIVLHASFPIAPEKREEALDLIEDLVEQSQAEEGMIDYRATTDVNDPNMVRFFEQYEDEAAFETHADRSLPRVRSRTPRSARRRTRDYPIRGRFRN
jgi:quinol monooxygenase YgiN